MRISGYRTTVCRVATACILFVLLGCADTLERESERFRELRPRLREVQAVRLEELSQSTPLTVEQATENLAERVMEEKPPKSAEVTLAEVRAAALANNLGLKVQLVNPSIAHEELVEEEAKFESLLTGSVQHSQSHGSGSSGSEVTSTDVGIAIPIRTGGTAAVEFPFQADIVDESHDTYAAALSFSISQPLLRNAGVRVNTASIRIAGLRATISDAQTKLRAISILGGADRAYWRLYAARRQLDVVRQQYDLALKQVEVATKKVRAGAAPRIEITRAESGLAERLEGIIVTETLVRERERELKRIMNREDMPIDSELSIITLTQPRPVSLDLDPEAMVNQALAERMDLFELELALAVDEEIIRLRRNAILPRVDLKLAFAVGAEDDDFGSAFGRLATHSSSDTSVGLAMEIPIGNEVSESRLGRARLQRLRRRISKEQRELIIRQEVCNALDRLKREWERILVARQGTIIAGMNYEAERSQFGLGLRTSIEVLEAATRLAQAQLREIQALADYEISKSSVAVSTGALLGYHRVRWEPTGLAADSGTKTRTNPSAP